MVIIKQAVDKLWPITLINIGGKDFEVGKMSGFAETKEKLEKWVGAVIDDTIIKNDGADIVLVWYTPFGLTSVGCKSNYFTEVAVIAYKKDVVDVF